MIKIGVVQIKNSVNVEENFKAIQKALSVFENSDVDVILFPECSLSGFAGNINGCDEKSLEKYFVELENWSLKNRKYVFLPTAIKKDEKIYNSGYFFGDEQPRQFFKLGLTDSEKSFFSLPRSEKNKIFKVKGYNLALIICYEAELGGDSFFKSKEADIVLWPGYWKWDEEETWSEYKRNGESNKIYENMKQWKLPLIQANFSVNNLADHSGEGPHGLSMFINSDNSLFAQGGFNLEACYEIHVADNEIKYSQKLSDI